MSRQKSGRTRRCKSEIRDVVIENSGGQLLTLSTWEGDQPAACSVRLTDGLKSSIAAAIRPGMEVLSHAQAANNAFTVVFQPRVADGLANQSMKLMQGEKGVYLTAMETVVTKNGKTAQRIAGNGQLVANNVQRVAHISMAALQVAAVVTAQAYLAEIDRKLTTIQEGVDAIREWLEAKEWSQLQGNYAYLASITDTIRAGGLTGAEMTVYLGQFENIEREALATADLWQSEMQRTHTGLPEITKSLYSSGAREDMHKLNQALSQWVRFAEGCIAVQQLRMVALHLRGLLGADEQLGIRRLASTRATLTELGQLWINFSHSLRSKAAEVDSHFDKGMSAVERREFYKRLEVTRSEVMHRLSGVTNFHRSVEDALEDKKLADKAGLALLVSTDAAGSIKDLKRIVLQTSSTEHF